MSYVNNLDPDCKSWSGSQLFDSMIGVFNFFETTTVQNLLIYNHKFNNYSKVFSQQLIAIYIKKKQTNKAWYFINRLLADSDLYKSQWQTILMLYLVGFFFFFEN